MTSKEPIRCAWATNELSIRYHDEEWGVPVHDDRTLFEFLILEGAQAGLSWNTILNKRDNYRRAFDGFDPKRVAQVRSAQGRPSCSLIRASFATNSKSLRPIGERESVSARAGRVRQLRSLHLAIRRRQAAREQAEVAEAGAGENSRIRCDEQGSEASRIQVRRIDHLLRLHAGGRDGERSRGWTASAKSRRKR